MELVDLVGDMGGDDLFEEFANAFEEGDGTVGARDRVRRFVRFGDDAKERTRESGWEIGEVKRMLE